MALVKSALANVELLVLHGSQLFVLLVMLLDSYQLISDSVAQSFQLFIHSRRSLALFAYYVVV